MDWRTVLKRIRQPITAGEALNDPSQALAAGALHAALGGLLCWLVVFFAVLLPFVVLRKAAAAAMGIFLLIGLVASIFLLRRGRVRPASWIFIGSTGMFLMIITIFGGGTASPELMSGLAIVVTAAWMLGRRVTLVIAGLWLAVCLGLAISALVSLPLPQYFRNGPLITWWVLVIVVGIAMLPLNHVLQTLNRAVAQAKESEQRYRAFVANTGEALWRFEFDEPVPMDAPLEVIVDRFCRFGRLSECNDAYARLRGKSRAQLAGVPARLVMNLDDPQRMEQARQVLAAAITGERVEIREELPDGSISYRVVTPTPILENGRMVQLWGITTDITPLKQAELAMAESESRYHAVFNNAPSGLLVLREGKVVDCNQKAEQLFGRSTGQFADLGLVDLSPAVQPDGSSSKEAGAAWLERASAGTPQAYEWQFRRADGVVFDAEVGLNPVDLTAGVHLLAVVRDVTTRKQRDVELRELKAQLERENLQLREVIHVEQEAPSLVGQSDAMRRVMDDIRTVAPTGAAVLIVGETGVGKELVARAVHQRSLLADRPLVTVNCAALASTLIESEFFGHERGAFTGAVSRKIGRFELADGGTIFLDEVGDLPLDLQAKLLRVLQNGEFERVGGTQTLRVNVRVISATNRNLQEAVRAGNFRADLYYRLSVFPIEVPALRNRRSDIPLLVKHFLNGLSRSLGKPLTSVTPRSLDALMTHDWPGNVRELLHVLERAAIRTRGTIVEIDDLGVVSAEREHRAVSTKLHDIEKTHILEVLKDSQWVIEGPRGAANKVGLHPNTLRYRMKKLGIERPLQ